MKMLESPFAFMASSALQHQGNEIPQWAIVIESFLALTFSGVNSK